MLLVRKIVLLLGTQGLGEFMGHREQNVLGSKTSRVNVYHIIAKSLAAEGTEHLNGRKSDEVWF